MCFLPHIVFPVRWLRRSFIIVKVPPQFLFQGREGGKVCSCHLETFNRKEKHNTYTPKFIFFGPQCKLLGPPE